MTLLELNVAPFISCMLVEDVESCRFMVEKFLRKSKDHEMTVDRHLLQLREASRRSSAWLIFRWGTPKVRGFFYATRMEAEYGGIVGVVNAVYLDNIDLQPWILHEIDQILEGWAKNNKISELAFFTRRNPKAFMRRLKNKWELDSYVVKRKLA